MTPEEIIEGNRLIAEFDGGVLQADAVGHLKRNIFFRDMKMGLHLYNAEMLSYHLSFDWLMSVVEKIENDYTITIRDKTCEIVKDFAMPTHEVMFCNHSKESKIEAIWLSVIDFIWYNQTKK